MYHNDARKRQRLYALCNLYAINPFLEGSVQSYLRNHCGFACLPTLTERAVGLGLALGPWSDLELLAEVPYTVS
jgi:hypothetical protein